MPESEGENGRDKNEGDRWVRKRRKQISNGVWEMERTVNRNRKQNRIDIVKGNDTEVARSHKKVNVNLKREDK